MRAHEFVVTQQVRRPALRTNQRVPEEFLKAGRPRRNRRWLGSNLREDHRIALTYQPADEPLFTARPQRVPVAANNQQRRSASQLVRHVIQPVTHT
jgi:hypothetical protein